MLKIAVQGQNDLHIRLNMSSSWEDGVSVSD